MTKFTFAKLRTYAKKHMDNYTEKTEQVLKAICYGHGGKMTGILSISTSVLKNALCAFRRKLSEVLKRNDHKCICEKCFAANHTSYRKSLRDKLARNTELLTSDIITVREMPALHSDIEIFRIESFGDISNVIQAINYLNLVRKPENKHVIFAWWTKNPYLIASALKGIKKPSNLVIIYSSPFINECAHENILKMYPFIDKIFTVYEKDYARENGIKINCGSRECNKCRRCYSKRTGVYVNELLK